MVPLRRYIKESLEGIYSSRELLSVAREICSDLPGITESDLFSDTVPAPDIERDALLEERLRRLSAGEPLQYVMGSVQFCGIRLKCDRRALIPRPETTELVEWVAAESSAAGTLLDIGTGSGCIAVALACKLPGWRISAWDISPEALSLAAGNASLNNADIDFRVHDILDAGDVSAAGMFNAIVSNPPYIAQAESAGMESNVLDYEPHNALFVPDADPLLFYRAIASFALSHLASDGTLYFEINPLYADRLEQLLSGYGFSVLFRSDISGRKRMAKAVFANDRK